MVIHNLSNHVNIREGNGVLTDTKERHVVVLAACSISVPMLPSAKGDHDWVLELVNTFHQLVACNI